MHNPALIKLLIAAYILVIQKITGLGIVLTYDVKMTEEQTDTSEIVYITLFTTSQQNITPQDFFVAEEFNAAVLDSSCTKTVCRSKW